MVAIYFLPFHNQVISLISFTLIIDSKISGSYEDSLSHCISYSKTVYQNLIFLPGRVLNEKSTYGSYIFKCVVTSRWICLPSIGKCGFVEEVTRAMLSGFKCPPMPFFHSFPSASWLMPQDSNS